MSRRGQVLIALLQTLGAGPPPPSRDPDACRMCGNTGKNSTGECHHCGVYRCGTCQLYHLGDGTQACPGKHLGVEIPER